MVLYSCSNSSIFKRLKRKLDREYVLYGGAAPDPEGESNKNDEVEDDEQDNNNDDDDDDDEEEENPTSVSGTKVYDTGNVKVMVTTSEISREDDFAEVPKLILGSEKKPNLPVIKKKPLKKVERRRSRPKAQTKRDKRKGKTKVEKRH
ncbi:hypothetical protein HanPI659440_Chr17g0691211 [Helianthus annuus]|nr:hypothetical protein HanPI659440_Chr17g0691211 [Helianthus annuus]